MEDLPSISEAESAVMEVLWRTSPVSTEEVVAALKNRQDWQEPTIKRAEAERERDELELER